MDMTSASASASARTDSPGASRAIVSPSGERLAIVAGLGTGAVLGLIGGFLPAGPTQNVLYALSSIGLVMAAALLAAFYAPLGEQAVAAGFGLLVVAEVTIWSGGPGSSASFAAGVLFYVPALLLISLPTIWPVVVRGLGVISAAAWAIYAIDYLLRAPTAPPMLLQSIGYALLTFTVLGWAVAIARSRG